MHSLIALLHKPLELRRPRLQGVKFSPNGLSALLVFPRLDAVTYETLDEWLTAHPSCRLLLVNDLPSSKKELKRLLELRQKHGIGIQIRPLCL